MKRITKIVLSLLILLIIVSSYFLFFNKDTKVTDFTETKKPEEDESVFSSKDAKIHIVGIGDSLTQGVGDSTKSGGYIGQLTTKLTKEGYSVEVDNHGHAGDRTDQLLKQIEKPEVTESLKEADAILITIGANDILKVLRNNITSLNYSDFEKEEPLYEERLESIFSTLLSLNPDVEIYMVGFYNPFEKHFPDVPELEDIVNEWNETSKAVVESLDSVYYIPTKDIFDHSEEHLFYKDNFHPNDTGYQLMAERVLERIIQ